MIQKVKIGLIILAVLVLAILGIRYYFTPEQQNLTLRTLDKITGFKNGQIEVRSLDGSVTYRIFQVDKFTTTIKEGSILRPYRFGYGYIDLNLNDILDEEEKLLGRSYFEIPNTSDYVFFERKYPHTKARAGFKNQ